MDTTSSGYGTRGDALRYVSVTLGEAAPDFDIGGIADDVHQQLGHWHFAVMDQDDDGGTVDYWATVRRHERTDQDQPIPMCPSWCQLPAGHVFELQGDDGASIGYHEGRVANLQPDRGDPVTITVAQQVTLSADGPWFGHRFIALSCENGAEYTSPHTLRDLGDAIRKAAAMLDGQQ